ncbi:hypothetical protein GN278_14205 [Rhodobacteraceae bacterium Araon29]
MIKIHLKTLLALVFFFSISGAAFANSIALTSITGDKIDLNQLIDVIRKEHSETDETRQNFILSIPDLVGDIAPTIDLACGLPKSYLDARSRIEENKSAFGEQLYQCTAQVFKIVFAKFGTPKRSSGYLDNTVLLALECGYVLEGSFQFFALGAAIQRQERLENNLRFVCNDDYSASHLHAIKFAVEKISNDLVFYHRVLGNWELVDQYLNYQANVSENREDEICQYLKDTKMLAIYQNQEGVLPLDCARVLSNQN